MKLSNLRLFYASRILTSFYFWIAIAIPYLTYRGLTPVESFGLISIYNFLGVLFEYPTGVVGDKFGYKKMLFLSNIITFLSMLVLASNGGYWVYLFGLVLLALGSGLLSGNDVGLLKSVSLNVKKDTANYYSNTDFVLFLSSVLAGFVSKISFELALYLSGFFILAANIPLYFVKSEEGPKPESFRKIISGSVTALKNNKMIQMFIFTTFFGGFIFTIKSIFGSLGKVFELDVSLIGFIVGLGGLSSSIAARLYSKKLSEKIIFPALLIPVIMFIIATVQIPYVIIFSLLATHFLFGFIISKIDGDLHEMVSDSIRASLFSLRRLVTRLMASIFLFLYGIAINVGGLPLIFSILTVLFSVVVLITWKYLANNIRPQETWLGND